MKKLLFGTIFLTLLLSCESDEPDDVKKEIDWEIIKRNIQPIVVNMNEYGTPYQLDVNTLGWEDGVYVSRDGLSLYCFYTPLDLLSMSNPPSGSVNPCNVEPYMRGPSFGILDEVPPYVEGSCDMFLSSDILISQRASINEPFPSWSLSNIKFPATMEGAPQFIANEANPQVVDFFVFVHLNPDPTLSDNNTSDIYMYENTSLNPDESLNPVPEPVYSKEYNEDNPHLERVADNHLVLYFTSEDRPGALGSVDIFASESKNNGKIWSEPTPVNFNSAAFEDMPHLWKSENDEYWMYYMNNSNSIARRKQLNSDDWINWGDEEVVLESGNAHAVGEPTLTTNGDIYFSLIVDAGTGFESDTTNRYDNDVWILPKK